MSIQEFLPGVKSKDINRPSLLSVGSCDKRCWRQHGRSNFRIVGSLPHMVCALWQAFFAQPQFPTKLNARAKVTTLELQAWIQHHFSEECDEKLTQPSTKNCNCVWDVTENFEYQQGQEFDVCTAWETFFRAHLRCTQMPSIKDE